MAIAKKCDRCGVYYDKNEKHRIQKRIVIGCDVLVAAPVNPWAMFKYDLCDDCITELRKFLNIPEPEEPPVENDIPVDNDEVTDSETSEESDDEQTGNDIPVVDGGDDSPGTE